MFVRWIMHLLLVRAQQIFPKYGKFLYSECPSIWPSHLLYPPSVWNQEGWNFTHRHHQAQPSLAWKKDSHTAALRQKFKNLVVNVFANKLRSISAKFHTKLPNWGWRLRWQTQGWTNDILSLLIPLCRPKWFYNNCLLRSLVDNQQASASQLAIGQGLHCPFPALQSCPVPYSKPLNST